MKKVSNFKRRLAQATLFTFCSFSLPFLHADAADAVTITYSGPIEYKVTTYDAFNSSSLNNTYTPVTTSINGRIYTYYTVTSNTYNNQSEAALKLPDTSTNTKSAAVEIKTVAAGTKWATELYIIRSSKPGPTVMIVGGIHGNETAGYRAAEKIKDWKINCGTLLVLPQANKLAIQANKRYIEGEPDLNRSFPKRSSESGDTVLARAIYRTVKEYNVDWLMDMHEGYDFYKNSSTNSVGQTLIYYPNSDTKRISEKIVNTLNSGIKTSYKQFSLLRYPVQGSLSRSSAEFLGVKSFIFETAQKQDLSERINYQLKAAEILLQELGMR
ncbi:Succinylglutamate desuccinylase / Aspartoacylase family protein [Thermosyntropha lipolytica DSM 11003]|uniref:Succinylglutamate desuccinylase / Aspartoacylase family protein n=1 Tax=Thermosyntropha lipolytica DSM 11003 TaxID=1123382 RepID=A0A1M5LDQ0_9FIRM|nr:succinylglutamate desuccinylase/aspartoacylase family protein [Thermosyntropha lipolytica]SHG62503.1 Succinylglutamate desuccinylase / Aspartoacylase family protein [Thermosyntropha lipolytica DSM 11003]